MPWSNITAVTASSTPEIRYVPEIIFLRPRESNSGPSSSGPARFPAAKPMRNSGTIFSSTP